MNQPLQRRAGANASPKPLAFQNVSYGAHRSYTLSQTGGPQLLIPGPPYPGTGSQNSPARAQDTPGQGDLGNERYMGARSRAIITPFSESLGIAYGKSGDVIGSIVLVRQNGKAITIGSLSTTAGEAHPGLYFLVDNLPTEALPLGTLWCLAPGEDILFIPNTGSGGSLAGEAVWIPSFDDVDLLCFRQQLTTQKQVVLETPPGKSWQTPQNFIISGDGATVAYRHTLGILNMTELEGEYFAYLNRGDGSGDILFANDGLDGAKWTPLEFNTFAPGFQLPAGHQIKIALEAGEATDDLWFAGSLVEVNQADDADETFKTPTVVFEA